MTNNFKPLEENMDQNSAAHPLQGTPSRRSILRSSFIGATAVASATLLATQTAGAASKTAYSLKAEDVFQEIMKDEDTHVAYLKAALASAARPKPQFKGLEQDNVAAFINLSQVFENVGVGAYLLAAPAISNKAILSAAGSILTIEARHAGYLNALVGLPLSTNGAFDKPIPQAQIVQDVLPFIASLNGGSDPSQPLMNDIDILNFALLLEYLEATFYDTNVPKFYK